VKKFWKSLLLAGLVVMAGGCATKQTIINHTFEFDARRDSPDIKILDYKYGNSKVHGTSVEEESLKRAMIPQQVGTYGPMLRGDFLYVKWRIKATGEVLEDRVDLRDRLPRDLKDHIVTFTIKGKQLYIYLVTPQRNSNPPSEEDRLHMPPIFRMNSYLTIYEIYPAKTIFKY